MADNVHGQDRGAVPVSSTDSSASRQLLGPLLVHGVPESAKKKAWAGQLVPLCMFLPGYSDHDSSPSLVPTQQEDGTFVFVSYTSEREKRLSKRALTPAEFVNAFTCYKEVILERFSNRARELDADLLHIIELANSYTGRAYWQYHTAFAKKAANLWAHGVRLDWAVLDPILLHQAIASERAHFCDHCQEAIHSTTACPLYPARSAWQGGKLASRLAENTSKGSGDPPRHKTYFKGEEVCENFNHRECKLKACKYKHVCKFCQSTEHPISMCKKFKRSQPE